MKCPNCGKEMKQTQRYADRWEPDDGFWTRDYIARITYYNCKDCNIKRKIDSDLGIDKWTLPKEMQPSEKQIAYAEKIREARQDGKILVTKHQYWEFINQHKDEMDKVMKEHIEAWGSCDLGDYDDYDYMPDIGINGF